MGTLSREGVICEKHGYYWRIAGSDWPCDKCAATQKSQGDLGDTRPDLDQLLQQDSVQLT